MLGLICSGVAVEGAPACKSAEQSRASGDVWRLVCNGSDRLCLVNDFREKFCIARRASGILRAAAVAAIFNHGLNPFEALNLSVIQCDGVLVHNVFGEG